MRTCPKCNDEKPETAFRGNQCRDCRRGPRGPRKSVPSAERSPEPQYRSNAKKAGIKDVERAVAARMAATSCEVCGSEHMLAMDHDHGTGIFRGILCSACNRALGALGDDATSLRRVLAYLERSDPGTSR